MEEMAAMRLATLAQQQPDKPAYRMVPSGEVVTYRELEQRSNRCAHLMRSLGVRKGDHVALLMENNARLLEIAWAARRSGVIYTVVNTQLTAEESWYIVNDCRAKLLFTSERMANTVDAMLSQVHGCRFLSVTGPVPGCGDYPQLVTDMPTDPIPDESEGTDMLYSSGTTGKPKGVVVPEGGMSAGSDALISHFRDLWLMDADTVYLSPAPLYHAAPLRSCMTVHQLGGTAIIMEKFDPLLALQTIEDYKVTHSQWVPTMFVRMLRLDPEARDGIDISSHRVAIHAAAPCPPLVKRQMMEWWGPILYEFYGATEGNGFVHIGPQEWLGHPGSVGRPMGSEVHIVDEAGNELNVGEDGIVYFSGGSSFSYHNDPAKTQSAYNQSGWSTVGDIGHVDEKGYLYLTDRQTFMIISGGVNIYPREIENVLVSHPKVMDAAVFGLPNADWGEEVKAVVSPVDPDAAGDELREELMRHCQEHLARYKCPRSIDFETKLPREDNGKLYKRLLRDRYLQNAAGP
jgi:acyl-CoA synthetase (AMP-forming)/AMP-acid ligase II